MKLDKGNKVFISRLLRNNNYIYPEKPNAEVRNFHPLWHISWVSRLTGLRNEQAVPEQHRSRKPQDCLRLNDEHTRRQTLWILAQRLLQRTWGSGVHGSCCRNSCMIFLSFLFYVVWSSFQDYATLQHILYDSNGNVELSTPVLESVFRGHMIRLLGWQDKKLAIYHKFTHRLYKDIMWVFALYQRGNFLIPIFQR